MGRARVAAVAVLLAVTPACSSVIEACQYAPQFRINGVVYTGAATKISDSDLAEPLGSVARPAGADSCESFTLRDGEGILEEGSEIYTVDGFEPSEALAVVHSKAQQPLLYRATTLQP